MGFPAPAGVAGSFVCRARLVWVTAGLAVIGLAVGLRFLHLTDKALWFDETVSIFLARQPLAGLPGLLASNDPHPPVYYVLLRLWMAAFGDGEAAVRSLSVLIGSLAVAMTWLFGRRVLGYPAAAIAVMLVAVAPSQVASAQEARMYSLLTLLSVLSWWAVWVAAGGEAEGKGHRAAWVAYALSVATMLYVHYYGFFVVASQALWLVWQGVRGAVWRRWMFACAGVVLLFLPWMPLFIRQLAGGRAWPAHRDPLTLLVLPDTLAAMTVGRPLFMALPMQRGADGAMGPAMVVLAGFAAVVALVVMAIGSRRVRGPVSLLLCAALGPLVGAFVVSMWRHVFAPRYLVFIVPPIALLIGTGAAVQMASARKWVAAAGAVLVAFVAAPNVQGTLAFYRQTRLDVFDWRQVSRTVAAGARDDDAIVFLPGFARIPVDYYFRGPQVRLALAPEGDSATGPGGVPLTAVVQELRGHSRVWILTVPPVPAGVSTLMRNLRQQAYAVRQQEHVNMVIIVLMERVAP